MKSIELQLPKDFDKSFTVFEEIGKFFPAPWHYHPEFEIVLVIKSHGRRMVGDNIGIFDEGDLVCMGPHLPHVWVNDPKFAKGEVNYLAEAIVIHFKENFLGEGFFKLPEMESVRNCLNLTNRGMVINGNAKKKIIKLMVKMSKMNGIQRLSSLLLIFEIMSKTRDYELLASPGFVNTTNLNSSDRLNKVTEYLIRNFHQSITLPKVASVANMAVTTFSNFFKENFRVTFVEYLNTLRIGYACKKLQEKDQNIVDVAYECGFNSMANFNRQFKKYKQMTPTEYRKTMY